MSINHKTEALASEVKRAFYATSMYSVCHELDSHAYKNVQSLEGVVDSAYSVCAHTYTCMHAHTQKAYGVMQWQEYHTYFPVRDSLSLLWGRKTTSMT